MGALSTYAKAQLGDAVLRAVSLPAVTGQWLALYTSDPGDDDAGTEVSGGSYARQATSFGVGVAGLYKNDALITFPTATAGWGTVTHFGLRDADAAGNLWIHGALTAPKLVETDDTVKVAVNALQVTWD